MDVCCPQKIDIKFEADDKIKKIKAGFDRSCVITGKHFFFRKNNINKKEKGNCYLWGGEPLQTLGGENYEGFVNLKEQLGINNCKIVDVGLGYMHTIVVIEQQP